MANPQNDSQAGWPKTYDPYTDDGVLSPTQGPFEVGDGSDVDVKAAGTNTDTRDGALRYGNSKPWAPRIT